MRKGRNGPRLIDGRQTASVGVSVQKTEFSFALPNAQEVTPETAHIFEQLSS
jgi:hypothetical protein